MNKLPFTLAENVKRICAGRTPIYVLIAYVILVPAMFLWSWASPGAGLVYIMGALCGSTIMTLVREALG